MIGNMSTPPKDWDARKGGIVRKRRQVLDWDQRQLAERVGVHVNSVQRWEAGKQYPGRHLGKLEAVLGLTIDEGLEREEPELPTPEELGRLSEHIREVLGPRAPVVQDAVNRALAGESAPSAGAQVAGAATAASGSESPRRYGRPS